MRVTVRAMRIKEHRWHGEIWIQPHQYAEIATYEKRARDHALRRSVGFDVPVASTMVSASLDDLDDDGRCELGGGVDDRSATVSGAGLDLWIWTYDGDVTLNASAQCHSGATWRLRVTAGYPGGDVQTFTRTGRCRHGSLTRGTIDLPDEGGVPQTLEAVVRDGEGLVERSSYRVGR